MKYTIGKVSFNKKSDIRVYIKGIIESRKISKKNEIFFKALLKYHPNQCWVESILDISIIPAGPDTLVDDYDIIDGKVFISDKGDIIPFSYCIGCVPTPGPLESKIAKLESKILDLENKLKIVEADNQRLISKLSRIQEESLIF